MTRSKSRHPTRIAVDESRLNMGNTYDSAPEYYYDIEFACVDCQSNQVWTAKQQKWWYEDLGGYFFSTAIRCRSCRQHERERIDKARQAAGHAL